MNHKQTYNIYTQWFVIVEHSITDKDIMYGYGIRRQQIMYRYKEKEGIYVKLTLFVLKTLMLDWNEWIMWMEWNWNMVKIDLDKM